jgi:hypothetical protein
VGRPKLQKPLVDKIAEAFAKVEKLPRRGKNKRRDYPFTYASDVLAAVRADLLSRGVLIHISEDKPEFFPVAQTNGGEQLTECRLGVTYTFLDSKEKLEPMRINGVGRDVEDKSIYKAQTGAQKALLKRFGLMAEETDDPEWDASTDAPTDQAQAMREAEARKPAKQPKTVTIAQIHAFNDACRDTGKSQDEVSGYLLTAQQVSKLADLGRGRPFTQALAWAKQKPASLSLAPKRQPAGDSPHLRDDRHDPQASRERPVVTLKTHNADSANDRPAMQPRLPLPAPAIEMKIGNKTVTVEPQKGSYAL